MSVPTGLIAPPPGLGQLSVLEPMDGRLGYSVGAQTAESAYLSLFRVSRPTTITTIKLLIGTAAGEVDVGFYTSDDTTWTRIASVSATAAAGSSAIQTLTLIESVTLAPGIDYWFAYTSHDTGGGVAAIRHLSGLSAMGGVGKKAIAKASAWSSGLPATITTLAGTGITVWWSGE